MYPAPTSLIPVSAALARFGEAHGFGGNYPFWYLGSTPFKYLTGPVSPFLEIAVKRLTGADFFSISIFLVFASVFVSALGWAFLALRLLRGSGPAGRHPRGTSSLSDNVSLEIPKSAAVGARRGSPAAVTRTASSFWISVAVFVLVLILPWRMVWGLAFGEVSQVMASAIVPWVLVAFSVKRLENSWKLNAIRYFLIPSLLFALLLLTNTTAAFSAVVGMVILAFAGKRWEEGLKRVGVVLLVGWALTLWWYGIGFWLTILGAPSFGGKSVGKVFVSLLDLARAFLPVVLAIFVVRFGTAKRSFFEKFALSWFFVFLVLTFIRFVSDFDFWLDWVSWMGELEIGLVLLAARNFQFQISNFQFPISSGGPVSSFPPAASNAAGTFDRAASARKESVSVAEDRSVGLRAVGNLSTAATPERNIQFTISNFQFQIKKRTIYYLLFTIYLLSAWVVAWSRRDFWLPRGNIESSVEYRISKQVSELVGKDQTVFLSGTTVYWLNAFYDVSQVRGGRDEASADTRWREAEWEIRNGEFGGDSARAMKLLGINYLVIHGSDSKEFYHDFRNIEKFERKEFRKVYEEGGDAIYAVK